jgi:uncharacterized protein YggE
MRVLLLIVLALVPLSVLADGGLLAQPYIYVKGNAEIEKSPDVVLVRFNLVARASGQGQANADLQARAAKVFAMLDERKIPKSDLVAEQIRSEPEFEQNESDPRPRSKLVGYIVTRPMAVKIRDINAFPKLIDDLIATVNAEVTGIEPQFSKADDLRDELWKQAMANARQQAERTAREAGMKIQSPYAISPVSIPEIEPTMLGKGDVVYAMGRQAAAEYTVPSEYRLAPIHFSQSVHVIYLMASGN